MDRIAQIETERLLLRGPAEGDVEAWASLITDPDFRRYIPVRRSSDSAEERATRALATLAERWTTEPLRGVGWVISRQSDGQMIGTGGLEEGAESGDGEIDYFLGKPFWGQGTAGKLLGRWPDLRSITSSGAAWWRMSSQATTPRSGSPRVWG